MLKKKIFSRTISFIAAFSMMLTVFAGMSVSANVTSIVNQSFYEDFEGYGDATYTNYNGKSYNSWEIRNSAGSASNTTGVTISAVEGPFAGSKAIAVGRTVASATTTSLNKDANIIIGSEDIIISGDVYIPAINVEDTDQRVRFYVSRGQTDSASAEETAAGWTAHNPKVAPAFGLNFVGNGTNWVVRLGTGTKANANVTVGTAGTNSYVVEAERWYNLCLVYHPVTGEVDYYIDGEFLTAHPVNTKVEDTEDAYIIPTLAPGKKLGNINLAVGGKTNEKAAMFDNISVTTVSSADVAKYTEVVPGTEYVFANWDIPVDKATVNNNVTVKKMAENDVTFSGTGATDADCTIEYKGSNGVGIKFNAPLTTPYERYQVKVTGAKDVYGKAVDYVYKLVIKDVLETKGTVYTETFNSVDVISNAAVWSAAANKWGSNDLTNQPVSYDANTGDTGREGVLKIEAKAQYKEVNSPLNFNLPVNDSVEYVDVAFDLKATSTNAFTLPIVLKDGKNARHTGIVVQQAVVSPAASNLNYLATPSKAYESINGVWKSYKLRYYPHKAMLELYMGDTQNDVRLAFTANELYTAASGGKNSGSVLKWNYATHGEKLTGLIIRPNSADTTILLDNIKAASYGYIKPYGEITSFADGFDAEDENWEAKNGNGQTASFEVIDGALKISTGETAYGQIRTKSVYTSDGKPVVNIPVTDAVSYIDADFKLKGEGTGWQIYVGLVEANGDQRHTGVVISDKEVKPFSRSGKGIDKSAVAIPSIIGTEQNCRLRYYPVFGKIEFYINSFTTPVLTSLTYADRNDDRTGKTPVVWNKDAYGSGIGGFSIQTATANTYTYLDNLSIKSYGRAADVEKAVIFENKNGSVLDNKAGAKVAKIYFDKVSAVTPNVAFNGNSVEGGFDATAGVYTMPISDMLVGNTNYTIIVNGKEYTFTTGDGEFKVSDLRFEKDNVKVNKLIADDVITAKVDVFNSTNVDETPCLIWAAYQNGILKAVDFAEIVANSGDDETKSADGSLIITGDYTDVKAFLWEGIGTIEPIIDTITIKK